MLICKYVVVVVVVKNGTFESEMGPGFLETPTKLSSSAHHSSVRRIIKSFQQKFKRVPVVLVKRHQSQSPSTIDPYMKSTQQWRRFVQRVGKLDVFKCNTTLCSSLSGMVYKQVNSELTANRRVTSLPPAMLDIQWNRLVPNFCLDLTPNPDW